MYKSVSSSSLRLFIVISIFTPLSIIGCGRGVATQTRADQFKIECSEVRSAACSEVNSNKWAYIGLLSDVNEDCLGLLPILNSNLFYANFTYSGEVQVSYSEDGLKGNDLNWINDRQMPMFSLPATSMKACGFIDVNENGQLDIGEPYLDQVVDLSDTLIPFNFWADYI